MAKKNSNGRGAPPPAELPATATTGNPPEAVVAAKLLDAAPGGDQPDAATVAERLKTPAGNPLDSAATVAPFPSPDKGTTGMADAVLKIPKPSFMAKFKSKRPPAISGVETVLTALKVMKGADANDFFCMHPDEDEYWSCEMCFVTVPILGQKHDTLHVIDEDLAMEHLESKQIKRFRLALASKPHDVFFLCIVPSQNIDNGYNSTALAGCELARTRWVQLLSRKAEGVDEYRVKFTRDEDPFPEPKWPTRSFDELLEVTFRGANIDTPTHPGLLRLIGAKQDLK
jgi:hypothetical protein